MVLSPEAMRKAQEELDRVVGRDRLPKLSDRDHLPSVDAVVKEVLRWNPPLPLGLPCTLIWDDTYRGYFIPAGATVIQNIWAVFRDPSVTPIWKHLTPTGSSRTGKSILWYLILRTEYSEPGGGELLGYQMSPDRE